LKGEVTDFSPTEVQTFAGCFKYLTVIHIQDGSNMTGTDLCVNKPQCAAAVRP